MGRRIMHTWFWLGNTRERDHVEDLNIDGMMMIVIITIIIKSFSKYVSNIPGNYEVKELQKTAILGTAHILRNVLT
jgi:hypothetical protein